MKKWDLLSPAFHPPGCVQLLISFKKQISIMSDQNHVGFISSNCSSAYERATNHFASFCFYHFCRHELWILNVNSFAAVVLQALATPVFQHTSVLLEEVACDLKSLQTEPLLLHVDIYILCNIYIYIYYDLCLFWPTRA